MTYRWSRKSIIQSTQIVSGKVVFFVTGPWVYDVYVEPFCGPTYWLGTFPKFENWISKQICWKKSHCRNNSFLQKSKLWKWKKTKPVERAEIVSRQRVGYFVDVKFSISKILEMCQMAATDTNLWLEIAKWKGGRVVVFFPGEKRMDFLKNMNKRKLLVP